MSKQKSAHDLYHELACYTLSHAGAAFIHQHAVDAFTAQQADENTKPISLAFALIGLYLYLEKNMTGKQVQQAHTLLARRKRQWPGFELPSQRGDTTVADVVAAPPGEEREATIHQWCTAVWRA